ncbi:MAG: hypothetical protein J0M34_03490 [Alphaproteobacteria bacterium]|nr:hypothetical protein [Alphaproteobacteria bacterium]
MFRILVLVCLISFSSQSFAGSDVQLTKIMQLARDILPNAKLSDGSFVPPETDEEKKSPVIPPEDAKRVTIAGANTGIAEWCGLDWQNLSYLKFMKQERAKLIWSDKQMAYIGLLHGIMQGATSDMMAKEKGACPPELAKQAKEKLLVMYPNS